MSDPNNGLTKNDEDFDPKKDPQMIEAAAKQKKLDAELTKRKAANAEKRSGKKGK